GGVTKINNEGLLTINKSKGLRDNNIRCIKEDREGNILIGTKETCLLVFN
ncbi:MAG: hypothetical protein HRT73_07800, partial [Flavobacteriales bacterium]|nr:hypothetical protein [Flavobacteriales bacterium]